MKALQAVETPYHAILLGYLEKGKTKQYNIFSKDREKGAFFTWLILHSFVPSTVLKDINSCTARQI